MKSEKVIIQDDERQRACLRSMTGFSSASADVGSFSLNCEIRSINSRFLDIVVRAPKEIFSLEGSIRREVGKFCSRGRVEVVISFALKEGAKPVFDVDVPRYESLYEAAGKILAPHGLWDDEARRQFSLDCLLRKEILREQSTEVEDLFRPLGGMSAVLFPLLGEALESLDHLRTIEGRALSSDIQYRRELLFQYAEQVSAIHQALCSRYRSDLTKRCQQLVETAGVSPGAISEERIIAEVALLVERSDITEELVRLRSHLDQIDNSITLRPAGRRLDFLLQECLREVNTIGSKVQDAKAQHLVVEMKVEIEKMKEQVQNVE